MPLHWIHLATLALTQAAVQAPVPDWTGRMHELRLQVQQADTDSERRLFLELQQLTGQPLAPTQRELLLALRELPVISTVAVAESVVLREPQYPVARLAQSLLQADTERLVSEHSMRQLHDPEVWLQTLQQHSNPAAWRAPLASSPAQVPNAVRAGLVECAPRLKVCADALLGMGSAEFGLDVAEVQAALPLAEPAEIVALAMRLDPQRAEQVPLLELLSIQGPARGVALQRLTARLPIDFQILAEPLQGAELAAVLAARLDAQLLKEVEQQLANSGSTLQQQRLLLVLRLADYPPAQAALERWRSSPELLAETRQALQSW